MPSSCDPVWIVNPSAGGGRGRRWWETQKPEGTVVWTSTVERLSEELTDHVRGGCRRFVAVGGDGTVHWVVNALVAGCRQTGVPLGEVTLGAVPAGSSNDYHKNPALTSARTAAKVDFASATSWDLLEIEDVDSGRKIYAAVNVSAGLTAAANEFFNAGGGFLGLLRRCSVDGAILWAAVRTWLWYRPRQALILDKQMSLTSLGVVKNPCFAGEFRYPHLVGPNDGRMGLFLVEDLDRWSTLRGMAALREGRFDELPRACSRIVQDLQWTFPAMDIIEVDGEIYRGRQFRARCLPETLRICRR